MNEIKGWTARGLESVEEAFAGNFVRGAEVGAAVSVWRAGVPVVELWAGHADAERRRPWRQDTVTTIASTTKSMAVIATLQLIDAGVLELDRPVADYWPEFGCCGKEAITLRMVLAHRSGVVSLEHAPITYEGLLAGTPIIDAIAAAVPQWSPDTAHGYHGVTIGHLLSAVIMSVRGQTVGEYFAEHVAGPLKLDCYIGLPEHQLPRLAGLVVPTATQEVQLGSQVDELAGLYQGLADPTSLTYRAMYGSFAIDWDDAADPRYALVEAPSTDGTASASGLAKLYAATLGPIDGVRLVGPRLMAEAAAVHSSGIDRVLGIRTDWGLGFMTPGGPFTPHRLPRGSYGHGGATGSFAFADPENDLAFGYAPNRGSELIEGNDLRVNSLVDALYRSL